MSLNVVKQCYGGEGGIVQLSRCLRESLIPHFIRDCPAGILRKQCLLVKPKQFRPHTLTTK